MDFLTIFSPVNNPFLSKLACDCLENFDPGLPLLEMNRAPSSGLSLRILVAGERCNVTGEYFERGSTSEFKIVIGYRTFAGESCVINGELLDLQCLMNMAHQKGNITQASNQPQACYH